ncbi:MAG: aromatic ring-hydroxylating dioxygenase subunit alpha [Novosphingobium sp.]|nr:aromatic ring-hydroxylating dioxygenase subunit alpha [Novosphingobium sp.]MCP5404198.1 aromatic ring-hydroxylating dioxygenase subunit alpha [Novosphingobium sp.]
MRCEPHPISGAVYEAIGDGLIRVEDKAKGKSGVFRWDGTWIEGNLTYADPHMLIYVGGPDLPPGRDIPYPLMPPLEEDIPEFLKSPIGAMVTAEAPQDAKIIAPYVGDPGMETPEGMRSASHIPLEDIVASERRPDLLPPVYKKSAPLPGGPVKTSVARYIDRKYHDLEVEHIWKKVWQMVCRVEDIPEVGDYHLYEIANLQYLVVRTGPDEFKAHVNACLHRGRQLRECHGKKAQDFRCPFHGWTWNIDGSLKLLTAEWDFPEVREDVAQLPGAKVATWGGFIFINPDPDAISLEEYMGPEMLEQYAKYKLENRYKQADVVKVIRANWKAVQEAFLEGWHSLATHPQLLLMGGDVADVRFDVFGNWCRMGHAGTAGSSPHRGIIQSKESAIEQFRATADFNREYLRGLIGDEADTYSDLELNEQTFNNLFPNFSPWGGWARIAYRFRPNGDNHEECLMQVMMLAPWPEGKPKPPPKEQRFLGPDDHWTQAPELGSLAKIFEQDSGNIPQVYRGMKTKQPPYVWYSAYQESVIRNFHRLYEERLGLAPGE